jgi:hypothetical protein
MAISLGSLYVELKANTAQFIDAMTKAAVNTKAFSRDIAGALGKVGEMFAALGPAGQQFASVLDVVGKAGVDCFKGLRQSDALLGAFAGLTGAGAALGATLFGAAEHASRYGSQIYEASEKTGISAAQMSGLMALTKETGGSFDALTISLARAGANLQAGISDPGGKAGKVLAQVMGGAQQLAAEGLKPMGDRIQDVLKHIFALSDAGQRNMALSTLLGRGWMSNVETLHLLAEQGYGPAEAAARRMGIFFDSEGAKQAKNFQNAINDLKGTYEGLGTSIGQKVTPYMTAFVENCVFAIPYLQAYAEAILAGGEAMIGHFKAAQEWADKSEATIKGIDQYQTDYLVHLDALTRAAKDALGAEGGLTGATKGHADALAALIAREQEQLGMAKADGDRAAEAGIAYGHLVDEIRKAGGSLQESLQAQSLAWDIFIQKMRNQSGKAPLIFSEPTAGPGANLAALPMVGQVPGFPPPAVIEETTASVSMLTVRFKEFQAELVKQGQGFGQKVLGSFIDALDQTENKLAQLVVKGRANFREIIPALEESVVKAGLQKAAGGLAGIFGPHGGGSRPAGTQSDPIFTVMAGGVAGAAGSIHGLASVTSSMTGALGGFFSKIFGGALAEGGDVSPGRAYLVGEKHPEFFVPHVSGAVAKSLPSGGNSTVVNMHIHTADADSFRRSGAQIMGDLHRTAQMAFARNS